MSKKAQAYRTLYFPFIIFCVVYASVFMLTANTASDNTVRVSSLEGFITRAGFENKISYTDPFTLRVYPMTLRTKDDFKHKVSDYFIVSGKDVAYRIFFDGKEDVFNKDLFLLAKRTSPFGDHYLISTKRKVNCLEGRCGTVLFEMALPKVYDVK